VEVRDPKGKIVPFQVIPTEHTAMPQLAWRKRVAVPVTLPPLGWAVYTMGYVEGAKAPASAKHLPPRTIRNAFFEVAATPGSRAIVVRDSRRREITRITAATFDDPWGAWGGMNDEPESCDFTTVRHSWKITAVETLERGPEKFALGVKLTGGNSSLDLRLTLWRGRQALDVSARVLWDERSARLKLTFTGAGDSAEFQVPGGTVTRRPCGEAPGGRWVRSGSLGFASDSLYSFDLKDKALRATVCRASRYANDVRTESDQEPWLPAVDRGELKFQFLLTTDLASLPRLAAELEQPPVVLQVPPSPGALPRKGTFMLLRPASLGLLALKPAEDGRGVVLRAQASAVCQGSLEWLGRRADLGKVRRGEIATWRIDPNGKASRLNAVEERG
jgi:alpha-mannosidase